MEDFDEAYLGTPPWDIGRPQPVFVRLAEEGAIRGRVLDAGCGTGEHVLMVAAMGLDATGIDAAPTAIEIARRKAAERGVTAGFHVFDDESRARYVVSLAAVVPPGGRYLMACFSDLQPGDWGPRRVSQAEIRDAFARGWSVDSVSAEMFETNMNPSTAHAWLARMTRV